MKEWFTSQEIADLKLPSFPNTRRGVEKWFSSRDYDALYPNKVHSREGRGGGVERHITLLPKSLQAILSLRHLKTAEAPAEPAITDLPEPPVNESAGARRDAILLVLGFWDIFRARFGGSVETARHHFCTMYAGGKIEGVPAWVRTALTTRAGRERGFCVNTLRRWEQLRDDGQFGALAGGYGNRAGTGVLDTAEGGKVAEFLAALIVKHPSFSAKMYRTQLQGQFGEELDVISAASGEVKKAALPPARTIQRWVAKWREDHDEALLKLTDPDSFKNRKRMRGSNMNHWVSRPNQLWEADASPADALLVDGRYAVYVVIDIYTRRMKVLVTKTPKTAAMLALLRRCILDWGVPEILRTDNGSDFTSYEFRRAMTSLGIQHDICDPFSPEQKGTVERHIGTLQRGFMPLLPGFIGHSVADRKKIEARKAFAQRLGETDEKAFCVELTHEQMQAAVDRWVADQYHHTAHSGLGGKTPFQRMTEWIGAVRRIENERALDLLLAPVSGKNGIRRVTAQGIGIRPHHYLHSALVPGEDVLCRQDPEDLGRLYVYSEDGREFICVAECPELVGTNPGDAVRAVRAAQAERMKNEVAPVMREIRRMKPTDAVDAALRVAGQLSSNVTTFPRTASSYTTPALDAAADAAMGPEPSPTVHTPEMQASIARIRAEIAEGKTITAAPQNPKDRYRHALSLQAALDAGQPVPPNEAIWLKGYRLTPEYQNQADMHRDFGDLYLGRATTA